ncbi:MAG: matrixin family metalloprotease [Actinomycetota bacterium]|nr:matrixin family metalloprotease [Actinomycetota bacterium]
MRRAVVAILMAGTLVCPSAASALGHRWIDGRTGNWVHMHTRGFPVYSGDLGGLGYWGTATTRAHVYWFTQTVQTHGVSSHDGSRIHAIHGSYGDTGWFGLATIEEGWDYNTGHYTHGHNFYNHFYLADSALRADHVACHEMGHSLGLDHTANTGSCMQSGGFYPFPDGGQDRDWLPHLYLSTGH